MRIRIIKKPDVEECQELEPFDVSSFQVGQVYNPSTRLAELLIVCGFAVPEMRSAPRDSLNRPR